MKVRIELTEELEEDEIILRCANLNEDILRIQNLLANEIQKNAQFVFWQGHKEYYLPLHDILFFQMENSVVYAHTAMEVYEVRYKLYELEEMLPGNFMRISKSGILNMEHIYSITQNLTSASLVEFRNTHKKIYVSRQYMKELKRRMSYKR